MEWYSDQLLLHGERLCKIAVSIFNTTRPQRCTPRYHSMHPSSPLNPMSLVSDLASVLRCPEQQPKSQQGVTQSQSAPLRPQSSGQGRALPTGLEASSRPSHEPLTPASESAPNPASWPKAQQKMAQPQNETGQEQLQFSSLQPSESTQQRTVHLVQSASVLDSQSAASSSDSTAEAAAKRALVCDEANQGAAAILGSQNEVSPLGQPNSLEFVPPESTVLSSTDEPEAPTAQPAPDRCIQSATLC